MRADASVTVVEPGQLRSWSRYAIVPLAMDVDGERLVTVWFTLLLEDGEVRLAHLGPTIMHESLLW